MAGDERRRHPGDGGDDAPIPAESGILGFFGIRNWPSRNFSDAIIDHKPDDDNDAVSCLTKFFKEQGCDFYQNEVDELAKYPPDSSDRQIQLCKLYSAPTPLYGEMNTALRDDDLAQMMDLAGYIWELREVFLTDGINQITRPFSGTVYRGIGFPDPETAVESYKKDQIFAWPQFSSTSTDRNAALNFGNIIFEIRCYPLDGLYDDDKPEYAPAQISQWSVFPDEAEVLFLPNTEFRTVNIQYPSEGNDLGNFSNVHCVVQCEITAFDSIYGMIEATDVGGVKQWAERNPDRVKTDDCEYSIVHHAADNQADDDGTRTGGSRTRGLGDDEDESMTNILLKAGANPQEECRNSGQTVRQKLKARKLGKMFSCF